MNMDNHATASIVYCEKNFRTDKFGPELDVPAFVRTDKFGPELDVPAFVVRTDYRSTMAPLIDRKMPLPSVSAMLEPTSETGWKLSLIHI